MALLNDVSIIWNIGVDWTAAGVSYWCVFYLRFYLGFPEWRKLRAPFQEGLSRDSQRDVIIAFMVQGYGKMCAKQIYHNTTHSNKNQPPYRHQPLPAPH